MAFNQNVFVNCPFDADYLPLLRHLLFTIKYLGLQPRIALETFDSGQPRIQKIVELINSSKYAIHDLSRLQAREAGEFYRLNMPFELGIDVGCKPFGSGQRRKKRCLVLEAERYRYRAAISDLSSSDIAVHGSDPEILVAEVRHWLVNQTRMRAPGPANILSAFDDFTAHNRRFLLRRGFSRHDIDNLPIAEFIRCIDHWLQQRSRPSN